MAAAGGLALGHSLHAAGLERSTKSGRGTLGECFDVLVDHLGIDTASGVVDAAKHRLRANRPRVTSCRQGAARRPTARMMAAAEAEYCPRIGTEALAPFTIEETQEALKLLVTSGWAVKQKLVGPSARRFTLSHRYVTQHALNFPPKLVDEAEAITEAVRAAGEVSQPVRRPVRRRVRRRHTPMRRRPARRRRRHPRMSRPGRSRRTLLQWTSTRTAARRPRRRPPPLPGRVSSSRRRSAPAPSCRCWRWPSAAQRGSARDRARRGGRVARGRRHRFSADAVVARRWPVENQAGRRGRVDVRGAARRMQMLRAMIEGAQGGAAERAPTNVDYGAPQVYLRCERLDGKPPRTAPTRPQAPMGLLLPQTFGGPKHDTVADLAASDELGPNGGGTHTALYRRLSTAEAAAALQDCTTEVGALAPLVLRVLGEAGADGVALPELLEGGQWCRGVGRSRRRRRRRW